MTIAIDFDGTIVEHRYPKIGNEIPFATDTLKMLIKDRHRLILWTVREGKLLDEAVEWCRERGVEFYAINRDYPEEDAAHHGFSRKVKADLFIDDRNLGGLPDCLATPRRAQPRTLVPAGSVGIGGSQTGIYPANSPGGWQVIGHTRLRLFDPHAGAHAPGPDA